MVEGDALGCPPSSANGRMFLPMIRTWYLPTGMCLIMIGPGTASVEFVDSILAHLRLPIWVLTTVSVLLLMLADLAISQARDL
jgi:hypothetical protein